jgi:hypothetical protein
MLEQAVTAFGTQRGLQRGAQADVGRELALRSRSGMPRNAPSVQGTLTATSSWVVPQAEADRGQHRGGGTYQNPFFPQLQRNLSQVFRDCDADGDGPLQNGTAARWPRDSSGQRSSRQQSAPGRPVSRSEHADSAGREMTFDLLFGADDSLNTSGQVREASPMPEMEQT